MIYFSYFIAQYYQFIFFSLGDDKLHIMVLDLEGVGNMHGNCCTARIITLMACEIELLHQSTSNFMQSLY